MQANNNPSDPALHKRVTNPDKEEYEPVVENLGKDCAKIYAQLEDCLAEHDRDWSKCQHIVKALKHCHLQKTQANIKNN